MASAAKSDLLTTLGSDGTADAMAFVADHQLAVRWVIDQQPRHLVIDFERALVEPLAPERAPAEGTGKLLTSDTRAGRIAVPKAGSIEVRPPASTKVLKRLERAGKFPLVKWLDDDTLLSSRGEVLNRWAVATGKPKKFKCHDDVHFVATTPALLAACNKEGVISIFDARQPRRLVCVRPAANGWLAFDDAGAWDASEGFTRGAELSWSDAKSTAFVPGEGFGWLELNQFPLTRVVPARGGQTKGLLALATAGRW